MDLTDFDATSPQVVLVIGNAYDTKNVAASAGYTVKFRTFDPETGRMGRQFPDPDGFALTRSVKDTEAAVGASIFGITPYQEDFTEVEYQVLALEPGQYLLFTVSHAEGTIGFRTCFPPPMLGFDIKAGEITYVGDIIFVLGRKAGLYELGRISRDDERAKQALMAQGGDPSRMRWQAMRKFDFYHRECPVSNY